MSKIYGIPVATPFNPNKMGAVKTVNGVAPDENGNAEIDIGADEAYVTAAVAKEKAERQTEIAAERARINQFVALEEGSTTGDAELMDLRVGYNGKVYVTAGEAVRQQIAKLESITTGDDTAQVENLFDGSLELVEGYRAQSTTAVNLTNPQVPMDLVDATHWIYPQLIELKQGTTYAFTSGHYLSGTIYKKLTGTKSGFITHDGNTSAFTESGNCLLYTTPSTDSDFWLAISFHQNYKDVADFQIVEGDSLPIVNTDGIFLREDIQVKAEQVVGINTETQAAIDDVRELAEASANNVSAVLYTEQSLSKNQQAQARANVGITIGYAGGSEEEEEEVATNLIDASVGWTSGYGQLAGPLDADTLEVPFDTALLKTPLHYTYNKLIPIKANTTYAFKKGYTILATAFGADTGSRSGYVTDTVMTEGDGCLLWTSLGNTAGYYLSVSIHRGNYENLDAFAIYEGTEIPSGESENEGESFPEGEYLADGILVKADQVIGINAETKAAIKEVRALAEKTGNGTATSTPSLSMDNFATLQPTARKIQNAQSPTTLTMSLMSDTHYHDDDGDAEGKLAAARLMGLLGDFAHVDFVGNLGDMVRGNEDVEVTRNAMAKLVVSTKQNAKVPVLFVRGNHDDNGWYSYGGYGGTYQYSEFMTDKEWYQAVAGLNDKDFVIDPNRPSAGYGYFDHEKSKIRVFALNTSDIPYIEEDDGTIRYNSYQAHAFSNEQLNFVANALLFADKDNPNEWAALFLAHVPLDTTNTNGYRFGATDHLPRGHECLLAIIAAYRKGTSFAYSGTTRINSSEGDDFNVDINIDYSSKGVGDVIGFIFGHTHADYFSRCVGYENSLSRNYAYIALMGSTHFANFVVDRENSTIHVIKYGGGVPIADNRKSPGGDLYGTVEDTPDSGSYAEGEWSVTFDQFRPNGESLYNGLSEVHATGVYPDNSSKIDLETLELNTAPQSGNYATSKAVVVKPFTRYAIPSNWNGLVRAFNDAGGGSGWLTPTVEDGYKVVTTGIRHYYLVFSHHTSSYTDYANFKIKEIYSGMEF